MRANKRLIRNLELKGLCGFLSPAGEYVPCEPWNHLNTAVEIVEKLFSEHMFLTNLEYERYLLEELGYVEFAQSGCVFRRTNYNKVRRSLTNEQKEFLENNIIYSKSKSQRQSIELVLRIDEESKEGIHLTQMEERYVSG